MRECSGMLVALGAVALLGLASCTAGPRPADRVVASRGYARATGLVAPGDGPPARRSSQLPEDVTLPEGLTLADQIPHFDDFSWRSFVALNWRAMPGTRDTPDRGATVVDPGETVVWETWKADYELFSRRLYQAGQRPFPWASWQEPSVCDSAPPARGVRMLAALSKFGGVLEDLDTGFVGPPRVLVAQNGTYVRYETRLNQAAYDSIRGVDADAATHLYLRDSVAARLQNGPPIAFAPTSIIVKAAWRELRQPQEAYLVDRYHHQAFSVVRPTNHNACDTKVMGLVGLHILRKTPGRPGWVWSTFEHVDNVPEPGEPPTPGRGYSFHNPASSAPPNEFPVLGDPLPLNPAPVQLRREAAIRETTQLTNGRYRGEPDLGGTVWRNYQLVATQWMASAGAPHPDTNVANVTLEPYVQHQTCVSCHSLTPETDFSWLLRLRTQGGDERARRGDRAVEALRSLMRQMLPREPR